MLILIFILLLGALGALYYALFLTKKGGTFSFPKVTRLETSKNQAINPLIGFLMPLRPLTGLLLKRFKAAELLQAKLLSVKSNLLAADFWSLKFILMAVFCLLSLSLAGSGNLGWIIVGALAGFFMPDLWLNQKMTARKKAIARVLPETIDLLGLCIGAGLDFTSAVTWIIDKAKPNPMIEELTLVVKEIRVGKPRTKALKDMSARLDIIDVSSFVNSLVLADRMGTSIGETFDILSDDMRMRRTQQGERQALKAPIKILIPLIFCILPIILIVVAGPIMIQFMKGDLLK